MRRQILSIFTAVIFFSLTAVMTQLLVQRIYINKPSRNHVTQSLMPVGNQHKR